jgi:EpsI family protein
MKSTTRNSLLFGLLMLLAAVSTRIVTPTQKLTQGRPVLELATLVPSQFGEWTEERNMAAAVINPRLENAIKEIYSQTLSRTYINRAGERVMLSIAYGDDQGGESTQAHRPEICYSAQGFLIKSNEVGELATAGRHIPVRRLLAVSGARVEPITYWVTVGDEATLPGYRRKLVQLGYGLQGKIPDGLLFRVSTIESDAAAAYRQQHSFVDALFSSLSPAQQNRLAGSATLAPPSQANAGGAMPHSHRRS